MQRKILFLSLLVTIFFNLTRIKTYVSHSLISTVYAPFIYSRNLIILLLHTEEKAITVQATNQHLRQLLLQVGKDTTTLPLPQEFITGDIVEYSPLGIPHEIIIKTNFNSTEPFKGKIATDLSGALAGKIVQVRGSYMTLKTIYDKEFKVGVESSGNYYTGVYTGGTQPEVLYVPYDAKVKPGDTLYTSSLSALATPGIPVGIVTEIHKDESNPIFLKLEIEPIFKPFTSRKLIVYGTSEQE